LKVISSKLRLEGNFDFVRLAKLTPGFVGADLAALAKEAAAICINRIFNQLETNINPPNHISMEKSTAPHDTIESGLDCGQTKNQTNSSSFFDPLKEVPPLTAEQIAGLAITMNDFEKVDRLR
jgi:ribosome biogenesis ATPase